MLYKSLQCQVKRVDIFPVVLALVSTISRVPILIPPLHVRIYTKRFRTAMNINGHFHSFEHRNIIQWNLSVRMTLKSNKIDQKFEKICLGA